MSKEIKDLEHAIAVLVGAGVKIDRKAKTQTYVVGMKLSDKVVRAAAMLDALFTKESQSGDSKREWQTIWVHKEGCTCVDCLKKHNKAFHRALKEGDLLTAITMFNAA